MIQNLSARLQTLFVLIGLVILFGIASPHFPSTDNLLNVMQQSAINAILGIGLTFVIISGGIDLSVGSILALCGLVTADLLVAGHSMFVAIAPGSWSGSGAARGNTPGTDQRDSMIYASTVDLEEAYEVGRHAAVVAANDGSGFMATILREPGPEYRVRYDKVPLEVVANSERSFPEAWITPSRVDVSDDFLRYAQPLIGDAWPEVPLEGGRQRFARLQPVFADAKLVEYVPEAHRE